MNNAGAPFVHIRNHEPLETRKNQNELLLQEDMLSFLLQCKRLFTPSNFTSAACLFATSEDRLYRSYIGFFRTDIPSNQYREQQGFQRVGRSAGNRRCTKPPEAPFQRWSRTANSTSRGVSV